MVIVVLNVKIDEVLKDRFCYYVEVNNENLSVIIEKLLLLVFEVVDEVGVLEEDIDN